MVLFIGTRAFVNLLPQEKISENIEKSLPFIEEYPITGVRVHEWDSTTQVDNCTELFIISCVLSSTGEHPIQEAVSNPIAEGGSNWLEKITLLTEQHRNEIAKIEKDNKVVYWWGIISVLRPLLSVMSYALSVKVIQLIFIICLFWCIWLIAKKVNIISAVLFVFALWSVDAYITSMNFYFASTFITMMCICIYVLTSRTIYQNYTFIFWIIGIITPYFDQLSATTLTFTIPFAIFILLYNKKEELSFKKAAEIGIKSSFMWCAGYFIAIVSKWFIAAMMGLADWNLALERVKASGMNSGADWLPSDSLELAKYSIINNYDNLNFIMMAKNSDFIKGLLILGLCFCAFLIVFYHRKFQGILPILCVNALVPVLWFIVFKGHSSVHCWFTYRHALASVWCGLLVIYHLLDFEKLGKTIKALKITLIRK